MEEQLSKKLLHENVEFVLFTTRTCPYCSQTKALLHRDSFSWKEFNVAKERILYSMVVAITGHKTVPAIYDTRTEEAVFIGGNDDLVELLKSESSPPSKGFFSFFKRK
jgi:glutaredoxin 3|tara:strand:- start:94 stop:417 length:324 start_codon:yes stop_codon:yes gene_type:complete